MTTRALAFVDPGDDRWQLAPATRRSFASDGLLLSWPQWRELRDQWPQPLAVGVVFPNDGDLAQLLPDLQRLALIALPFPKWTDGRAYSLARTLRVRHRYAASCARRRRDPRHGRATAAHRLRRRGAARRRERRGGPRMLNFFGEFYQADMQERRQRFARGAAAGASSTAIDLYASRLDGFEQRLAHTLACCATRRASTPAASCSPPASAPRTWCWPT